MKTKVFHIIECGDLSGAGKLTADICNNLSKDKFDIILIYAVRPSSTPEEFESIFDADIKKIFMPEMVRQPSIKKDFLANYKGTDEKLRMSQKEKWLASRIINAVDRG